MNNQHDTCAGPVRQMGRPGPEESRLLKNMLGAIARPDAVIENITAGPKFIAVCAGGRMGLSSLLGARPNKSELQLTKSLIGRPAADAASLLLDDSPFSICLGLAALNAADNPDPGAAVIQTSSAQELIADLGSRGRVGLVGHFPFARTLREKVADLQLFELKDVPGAVAPDRWDAVLSGLDVLALTATTLLTRQMAFYLSRAGRATIIVLGPSTPLSKPLFQIGADYLCGCIVTDQKQVLDGIRTGLAFRAIKKRGGIAFAQWTETEMS